MSRKCDKEEGDMGAPAIDAFFSNINWNAAEERLRVPRHERVHQAA